LVAGGAALIAFVLLAASVTRSVPLNVIDQCVQHAVLTLRSPVLTLAMQICTSVGTLPFVVVTALSGALILRRRTGGWIAPAVLGSGVATSALIIALVKVAVGRPRPGPEDRIGTAALDYAFPSGHTGNGSASLFLVTALVCLTLPRSVSRSLALLGAAVLSGGIGLTRVYLGYHWPSDVVGGWLLAGTVTCVAAYVVLDLGADSPRVRSGVCAPATVDSRQGR
jgi:membrane-associated phospholipid phosphatase